MAGCVTPSFEASAVSLHGPDRSSVASVAAVVSDRPGGLSQRMRASRRSSPAATSAACGCARVSITDLYYLLMLMTVKLRASPVVLAVVAAGHRGATVRSGSR